MDRDNLRGVPRKDEEPGNQQERPEIAAWISGFVDGEGCFSVSMLRNSTTRSGWQVFPEFEVTQGVKSVEALELIKEFFGCGGIYINQRHDDHREALARYCVRSQRDLRERIIPFFSRYPLRTAKRDDLTKFDIVLQKMGRGDHRTEEGLREIARIIETMNRKVRSRFLESSETARRSSGENLSKIQSDLHGDMQSGSESIPRSRRNSRN